MTVKDLIGRLHAFPPNMQVMILDGFNGGGSPREINSGPQERVVRQSDADECADCGDMVGQTVVVMGYGSY